MEVVSCWLHNITFKIFKSLSEFSLNQSAIRMCEGRRAAKMVYQGWVWCDRRESSHNIYIYNMFINIKYIIYIQLLTSLALDLLKFEPRKTSSLPGSGIVSPGGCNILLFDFAVVVSPHHSCLLHYHHHDLHLHCHDDHRTSLRHVSERSVPHQP